MKRKRLILVALLIACNIATGVWLDRIFLLPRLKTSDRPLVENSQRQGPEPEQQPREEGTPSLAVKRVKSNPGIDSPSGRAEDFRAAAAALLADPSGNKKELFHTIGRCVSK